MGVYSVNSNSLLKYFISIKQEQSLTHLLFFMLSLFCFYNKKMTTANGLKLFIIALKLKSTLMSATLDLIIKILCRVFITFWIIITVLLLSGGRMNVIMGDGGRSILLEININRGEFVVKIINRTIHLSLFNKTNKLMNCVKVH